MPRGAREPARARPWRPARIATLTGVRARPHAEYARRMKTLDLDDDELRLLVAAVRSYLDDFGHDEADVLRRVKQLLAKLQAQAIEPA
jgi:hypothetical protein